MKRTFAKPANQVIRYLHVTVILFGLLGSRLTLADELQKTYSVPVHTLVVVDARNQLVGRLVSGESSIGGPVRGTFFVIDDQSKYRPFYFSGGIEQINQDGSVGRIWEVSTDTTAFFLNDTCTGAAYVLPVQQRFAVVRALNHTLYDRPREPVEKSVRLYAYGNPRKCIPSSRVVDAYRIRPLAEIEQVAPFPWRITERNLSESIGIASHTDTSVDGGSQVAELASASTSGIAPFLGDPFVADADGRLVGRCIGDCSSSFAVRSPSGDILQINVQTTRSIQPGGGLLESYSLTHAGQAELSFASSNCSGDALTLPGYGQDYLIREVLGEEPGRVFHDVYGPPVGPVEHVTAGCCRTPGRCDGPFFRHKFLGRFEHSFRLPLRIVEVLPRRRPSRPLPGAKLSTAGIAAFAGIFTIPRQLFMVDAGGRRVGPVLSANEAGDSFYAEFLVKIGGRAEKHVAEYYQGDFVVPAYDRGLFLFETPNCSGTPYALADVVDSLWRSRTGPNGPQREFYVPEPGDAALRTIASRRMGGNCVGGAVETLWTRPLQSVGVFEEQFKPPLRMMIIP